jgi:hypothetical protein
MADKPGRRWREAELTGKEKAVRVLSALHLYAGLAEKVAVDRVLREKLELKTTYEREGYRKAFRRWHKKLVAEMAQKASDTLLDDLGEEKRRPPPRQHRPPGMVWRDGCWQEIEDPRKK